MSMSHYQIIEAAPAAQLLNQETALVIDLRDALAFRCGQLPGAINLPDEDMKQLLGRANRTIPVLLYCDLGDRAEVVADLFADFGFERMYVLAGGYEAWASQCQRNQHFHKGLCDWLTVHGYSCEDLSMRGFNDETALMFAARQSKFEYVIDLIDRGAEIDAINADGNTALWLACYANDTFVVEELLQSGANLDHQNPTGATALIYAASAGREDMVSMLLRAGADHQLTTQDGFSALDLASTLPILKMLRNAGKGILPAPLQQRLAG